MRDENQAKTIKLSDAYENTSSPINSFVINALYP